MMSSGAVGLDAGMTSALGETMRPAPIPRNTMVVAAVIAALASCEAEKPKPVNAYDVAEIRTDRAPIETRFPELGTLAEVTWIGSTWGFVPGRVDVPGPSDFRVVGVAKLSPGDLDRLTGRYAWATCDISPQNVPKPLAAAVGASGTWCEDPAMASKADEAASWSFLLDKTRGVVYFDSTNV
ncbi:hypothetical protein ACU686_35055 [Yinghuangia aomiensis]